MFNCLFKLLVIGDRITSDTHIGEILTEILSYDIETFPRAAHQLGFQLLAFIWAAVDLLELFATTN